jgi:hypothetical protein
MTRKFVFSISILVLLIFSLQFFSGCDSSSGLKLVDAWGLRSNLGLIVYTKIEQISTNLSGKYNIKLYSGNECLGEQTINWSNQQQSTLEWEIGSNTQAWARVTRGEKAMSVFQIKVTELNTAYVTQPSKSNQATSQTSLAIQSYQLSTSIVPTGGGTISPQLGTFSKGSELSLVANPAKDYRFDSWAGEASGSTNPLSITMNSNKQIVAKFSKITRSVQVNCNPGEGGNIYPAGGTFESGTQAKFTATPSNGYRFDHWSGAATGNLNNLSLSIDADKALTANFVKQYKLNINAPPDEGATVSPNGGIYDVGTKVNITAKSTICPFAFDHWSNTDNDKVNPTSVTMNADKSVTIFMKKLVGGQTVKKSDKIWGDGVISIPIDLNQFEWLQGEIWGPRIAVTIRDAKGAIVKDLGIVADTNFTYYAETTGNYSFVLYNTNVLGDSAYTLSYTIYHR